VWGPRNRPRTLQYESTPPRQEPPNHAVPVERMRGSDTQRDTRRALVESDSGRVGSPARPVRKERPEPTHRPAGTYTR